MRANNPNPKGDTEFKKEEGLWKKVSRESQGMAFISRGSIVIGITALSCLSAGCSSMCPSLFDYSGPVKNGCVTENNFAARSNGILPLYSQPKPWPTIVQSEQRKQETKNSMDDTEVLHQSEPLVTDDDVESSEDSGEVKVAAAIERTLPRALPENKNRTESEKMSARGWKSLVRESAVSPL